MSGSYTLYKRLIESVKSHSVTCIMIGSSFEMIEKCFEDVTNRVYGVIASSKGAVSYYKLRNTKIRNEYSLRRKNNATANLET